MKKNIPIPKFKIGDNVVVRASPAIYKLTRVTSAYLNINESKKEWSYFVEIGDISPVKESEILQTN